MTMIDRNALVADETCPDIIVSVNSVATWPAATSEGPFAYFRIPTAILRPTCTCHSRQPDNANFTGLGQGLVREPRPDDAQRNSRATASRKFRKCHKFISITRSSGFSQFSRGYLKILAAAAVQFQNVSSVSGNTEIHAPNEAVRDAKPEQPRSNAFDVLTLKSLSSIRVGSYART
jgi:hypothetical protein